MINNKSNKWFGKTDCLKSINVRSTFVYTSLNYNLFIFALVFKLFIPSLKY